MKRILLFCLLGAALTLQAQTEMNSTLPYHEIPDAPADYTSGNVIARTIDGLGYRYYWASEGLTKIDLDYQPSEDGRSTFETLEHLHGLSQVIANAPQNIANIRGGEKIERTYEQLRKETLENFKLASDLLRGKDAETVSSYEIVFQNGENTFNAPFWNMLNGPIGDALWHAGQIVVLRRASGNPINPNVSVFNGKNRQ